MKIIISTNTEHDIVKRRNLIAELKRLGHEILILAGKDRYDEKVKNELNLNVIHLNIENRNKNIFHNLNLISKYKKIYKNEKPDAVLHFNLKPNIYGTMAASKFKISSINNITGLGQAFEKKSLLQSLVLRLYKKAFRSKYCFVFFQNQDDKNLFLKYKLIKEEQTGLLSGSGVDLNFFNPALMGKKTAKTKTEFVFVGRLVLSKGIREYIKAAELIKQTHSDCCFHVFGSLINGDPKFISQSELDEACRKGIIEYHGFLDDEELRKFLFYNTDCVVFPSYYREGVPRVMLEGAAMEKPLIGADSVGTREPVVHGVNGYLCEPRNVNDLKDKIEMFLHLPQEQKELMGKASAKIARERFSEKSVIQSYVDKIKNLTLR